MKVHVALSSLACAAVLFAWKFVDNCYYDKFWIVYLESVSNWDPRFSVRQNLLVNFDKVARQNHALNSITCVIKKTSISQIIEGEFGQARFDDDVYLMPSNNYNYGVISISDDLRMKITAAPDLLGIFQLEDAFVTVKDDTSYKWLRYNSASKTFERQDSYCLSCHNERRDTEFRFDRSIYQRITD